MVKNIMFVEKGSLDANNYNKLLKQIENTNVKVVEYEPCMTKPEMVSIEDNAQVEENKAKIVNETMDNFLNALTEYLSGITTQYIDFDNIENREKHRMMYHGSRESFMANFLEFLNRG